MRSEVLRFGPFALDLVQQRLLCGDRDVALRPKCWTLLAHLAKLDGAVASREQLVRAVWPDTHVAPNSLNYLLWDLRRQLARYDDGEYITNVSRRGFRMPVERDDEPASTVGSDRNLDAEKAGAEPATPPSLLDRDVELARLQALFRQAQTGARQLVFVSGEAGIGKSSLAAAFLRDISDRCDTATVRCLEGNGVDEPYAPVLDVIEQLCARANLTPILRRYAPTWLVQLPELLPPGEMQALREALSGIGPGRMVREGVRLLEKLAANTPLVVIIEDLRHADSGTLAVLEALAGRSEPARLLVLSTIRSFDARGGIGVARALAARLGRKHAHVTNLDLQPLSAAGIHTFVARHIESSERTGAIARLLEDVSGGNPLFLTALAESLGVGGLLRFDGDVPSLGVDIDELGLDLPESVRDAIGEQLDLLPSHSIEILEAASVAGSEFTAEELAACLERPRTDVDARCARLAREAHFLVQAPAQHWPDGTRTSAYRFRHVLYQRALYDRVAPENRRNFHNRVGARLAKGYGPQILDIVTRLGEHFEAAENFAELAVYQELAAAIAFGRFSPAAALEHVRRATRTIQRLPPSPERDRREADRLQDLGHLAEMSDGFSSEEAMVAFDRAYEIAGRIEDPLVRFRAQLGRCLHSLMSGDDVSAMEAGVWLEEFAEAHGPRLHSVAYFYSAIAHMPEVRASLPKSERALAGLADDAWSPPALDLESNIGGLRAVLLSVSGSDEWLPTAERAEARILSQDAPAKVPSVVAFCACAAMMANDADSAIRFGSLAFTHANENDIAVYIDVARIALEWGRYTKTGRGLSSFERAVARRARSQDKWYQSLFEAYLAEALCRRGEVAKAGRWLDAAFVIDEKFLRAEMWRVRGEIHRQAGAAGIEDAEKCFVKARTLAKRIGATAFERRASRALQSLR